MKPMCNNCDIIISTSKGYCDFCSGPCPKCREMKMVGERCSKCDYKERQPEPCKMCGKPVPLGHDFCIKCFA